MSEAVDARRARGRAPAAIVLLFVMVACSPDGDGQTEGPEGADVAPSTVSVPPTDAICAPAGGASDPRRSRPRIVGRVATNELAPTAIAANRRSVWVASPGAIVGRLARLDARTGRVDDVVSVGNIPGGVAVSDDAVWVTSTDDDLVLRVDLATNEVTTAIPVAGPSAIAAHDTAVWVVSREDRAVMQIDPSTNQIAQTVPVDGAVDVAVDDTGVWVTNRRDQSVVRVDPELGEATAAIPVPDPGSVATADGVVWITSRHDDTVSCIDPATDQIVASVPVGRLPVGLVAERDGLWVISALDGTVESIDRTAGEVGGRAEVGGFPVVAAASAGTLWVAGGVDGTVTRVST